MATTCSNPLVIHHLNVGQGDATLIVGPNRKTILIDSGPPAAGPTLLRTLEQLGIQKIDLFVATHQDNDHIGGWARSDKLKGRYCPDRFYHGDIGTTANRTKVLQKLLYFFRVTDTVDPDVQEKETVRCRADLFNLQDAESVNRIFRRPIDLGDDARLRFVAASGYVAGRTDRVPQVNTANERSVAVYLEYGGFDYFIGGDLIGRRYAAENAPVEAAVGAFLQTIADSPEGDPVDMLHVGHHGGNNASEETFLQAIRPETAVASLGDNNGFCHPHPETIGRLRAAGLRIFLTNAGVFAPDYPREQKCHGLPAPSLNDDIRILHGGIVVYACPTQYNVCKEDSSGCQSFPTD